MNKILALMLFGICCLATAQGVKVGFARRSITIAEKDIKEGIKNKKWGARGKRILKLQKNDGLFVRAVAIRDKSNTLLVILTADTQKFYPAEAYILQEWFEKTFKTSRWHLIVNASHTHQGLVHFPPNRVSYTNFYHKIIMDAIKAAISEAVKNATTPMTVKFANLKVRKDMIFNKGHAGAVRRLERYKARQIKDKKAIDPQKVKSYTDEAKKFSFLDTDFPVFAFFNAKTDKIEGFLWSIAAHPTYICHGGMHHGFITTTVSSHFPGAVERALKKVYGNGVIGMFAQGAAGDLKVKFPGLENKIKYHYFRKTRTRGFVWTAGKDKGRLITQQQYVKALDDYGMLFADIIRQGFKDNKFKEIKNIDLKITGKEVKVPLAQQRPPKKNKRGIPNRTFWTRPPGSVEHYKKIIADKNATLKEKHLAYTFLSRIYDDKRAAYLLFITKIMLNKHLQIVAMSNEVCCEIGLETKKYYRQKGIETVFFGYSPFGSPYYPSNLHKAEETYQGSWMFPEKDFDFNKFALENITKL